MIAFRSRGADRGRLRPPLRPWSGKLCDLKGAGSAQRTGGYYRIGNSYSAFGNLGVERGARCRVGRSRNALVDDALHVFVLAGTDQHANQPIYQPVLNAAGRPVLLGYEVGFSPSLGGLTAGAVPILLGDFTQTVFRKVRDSLTMKVLIEKFALLGQVGYMGFLRCDFGVLLGTSGPAPVVSMAMA